MQRYRCLSVSGSLGFVQHRWHRRWGGRMELFFFFIDLHRQHGTRQSSAVVPSAYLFWHWALSAQPPPRSLPISADAPGNFSTLFFRWMFTSSRTAVEGVFMKRWLFVDLRRNFCHRKDGPLEIPAHRRVHVLKPCLCTKQIERSC